MRKIIRLGINSVEGLSIKILSENELLTLHQATLEIMGQTGVRVQCQAARDIFEGDGCHVDHATEIVRFPSYVVEEAISSAPSKLFLAGRNSKDDIVLEPGNLAFTRTGGATNVIDLFTGEKRPALKTDVANQTLLLDALEEYDLAWQPCGPTDVPAEVYMLHMFEAMITNTTKHIIIGQGNGELTKRQIEMAAAVVGGREKLKKRPIFSAMASVSSPLCMSASCCEIIMEAASAGIPVRVLSAGMLGASFPVTMAGGLVTHNAEVLSGIILAQRVSKGTAVIYGSASSIMDLRFAVMPFGCPEQALFNTAIAQLAQYYNICSMVIGAQTDSKLSDCQAGHEKTLTSVLPALGGATLIAGGGMVESVDASSYAQLVIDNEIFKMIKILMNGINVNGDTIALDWIKKIGPGGYYLETEHTFAHMTEQSHSELFSRKSREEWVQDGSKDLAEKAREEAISILEKHKPEPLRPEIASALRSILKKAEAELVGGHASE